MNVIKSGSYEEQMTPEFYKEFLKSFIERKKDNSGEKSSIIKEDIFLPNFGDISIIFSKEPQKQKENEDKNQERVEEQFSLDSIFASLSEFLKQQKSLSEIGKNTSLEIDSNNKVIKIKFKEEDKKNKYKKSINKNQEEEKEFKGINQNKINEIGKAIQSLIKNYMNLLKSKNIHKNLNENEKIILQRIEDQINECNSNIGKEYELENRINEQNSDKLNETEDLKNYHLDKENEKSAISNKDLEHERQREENSKEKNDLILSTQKIELENALKKKEEKEEKNRCNIKIISTKLKKKIKTKQIHKSKIIESALFKEQKENSEISKIFNKHKGKKIKYINSLRERNQIDPNNQKSNELNNKENDLKLKDDEIQQLKNKMKILENEIKEQKNQIMSLSEIAKEKINMKDENKSIEFKLSNLVMLNNQRNSMEMQELNLQNQNNSNINDNNSILSKKVNSSIIYLEEKNHKEENKFDYKK